MSRLEKPVYALLNSEPFYAHFLLGSRVVFDPPQVQTAACMIKDGEIIFMFNSEFYFKHTLPQQVAILKHEVLHVLLDHAGARGKQASNKQAANIAMDCAINQHIRDLPEGCVTLQALEKLVKKKLLPFETWEYYYDQMKDVIKEANDKAHDHDMMAQGEDSDLAKEQRRMAVKEAAGKATMASAGNLPDGLSSILGALNKAATIPWKQQLRNFVSSARSTKNKNTRMRANRRFDLDMPGRKKIRELVLGVCTDSSGSVSDESYAAFMTEISSIIKGTKVTYLVHADCVVQKVDVIKDGKAKAGVLTNRHGNGGTAYQPALTECVKRNCDAIIYFGDMDSADVPVNPGVPVIWVVVGGQNPPGDFGRTIRL